MKGEIRKAVLAVLAGLLALECWAGEESTKDKSPLDELPGHIRRVTHFGQRADWSHDGKRILFIEKTFGDVYEVDLETNIIRPMTHRYFHEGYTRALYLSNGDILLSGARQFDATNPWASRSERNAELWVLKKDLSSPPTPLGAKCSEGPAVSRRRMRIVWTQGEAFHCGDIVYEDGVPKLTKNEVVLKKEDLPFECGLETQNLRPPDEKELIFSAYGYQGTEVCGVNLKTGKVVNYSMAPDQYDEPEGIFPDGKHTLVECDKHNRKGVQHIDLYKLALDGSGKTERVTFFSDYPGYKASNPVVSDDGRYIAFQVAREGDPAGVGRGILIFDIEKAGQQSGTEGQNSEAAEEAEEPEDEDVSGFEIKEERERQTADEPAIEAPQTLEERIARIEADYGIKIHHKYDAKTFFPAEWLGEPINAEGLQMPKEEADRVVGVVEKFVGVYPKEMLTSNLTDIYLISDMKFFGKVFGAAYGRSAIYVNSEGQTRGYTEEYLLGQMHSELSSLLLINHRTEFPEDDWRSVNAQNWEYGGTAGEMSGRRDVFRQTDRLLSAGFLAEYSQRSLEDDLNMFAAWAFTKTEALEKLVSRYVRISEKYRLVVQFYKTIDPNINIGAEPEGSSLVNWTPDRTLSLTGG